MRKLLLISSFSFLIIGCHTARYNKRHVALLIPPNLLGKFVDDYGTSYVINSKVWKHGSKAKYYLLHYNEDEQYFITKNDQNNPSDGGKFTRIDVVNLEGMTPWLWGYCFTVYDATTEQEAITALFADRQNLRKGCNGYPFSRMKRK